MNQTKARKGKSAHVVAKTVFYVLMILMVIVYIFPFYWIVVSSLKASGELVTWPPTFVPKALRWDNYEYVLKNISIVRMFFNSLFVSCSITLGQVMFCSLAGYSFARLGFPGREALFKLYLATMMIPGMVILIPLYIIMSNLGLVNTYQALILPSVFGSAFGVFLTRQFFLTLPPQLGEAAHIDGANQPTIFFRVYLPLIKPIIATLSIFSFMNAWNDFLWPLIVIQSDRLKTLTLGLAGFQTGYGSQFNVQMAGTVLSILPVLIAFLSAQKYFIEGIALSGMKA